jgi:hypothetical protein
MKIVPQSSPWLDLLLTGSIKTDETMTGLPSQVADTVRMVKAISQHIQHNELVPFTLPDWSVPVEMFQTRGGKFLHRLYFIRHKLLRFLTPTRLLLPALMFFLILSEPLYLGIYYLLAEWVSAGHLGSLHLTPRSALALLSLLVVLLFLVCIILYCTFGGYWTFITLIRNRLIPWYYRGIVLMTAAGLVIWWLVEGSGRVWDHSIHNFALSVSGAGPELNHFVSTVWESRSYMIVSAILIYVPAIMHGALWLARPAILDLIGVAVVLQWMLSYHILNPIESVGKFIVTPLALEPNGELRKLLDLNAAKLTALQDWSDGRRQIVQNKLIPTTIMLAFLGLLANTTWGDGIFTQMIDTLSILLIPPPPTMDLSELLPYLGAFSLLIALMIPVILIVMLLNEVSVMDYISQACVLAQHAQQADSPKSHVDPRPVGLLGWVRSWLH